MENGKKKKMIAETAKKKVERLKERFSKHYSENDTPDYHKILHSLEYLDGELSSLDDRLETKQNEMELLRLNLNSKEHFGFLSSKNKTIQTTFTTAEKYKNSQIPILILGERGTGKEALARVIHIRSEKKGAFIVYDRSMEKNGEKMGDQQKEWPENSTLYLPEVSLTTPYLQKKILEWIDQTNPTPPRLMISAKQTNDLEPKVIKKTRLIPLQMIPLRERKEDLLPMIDFFVREFSKNEKNVLDFSPSTLNKLLEYHWPGNMSELKLEIKRILLDYGDKKNFTIDVLPEKIIGSSLKELYSIMDAQASLPMAIETLEKKMVIEALIKYKGNKSKVSRELGISRSGLIQKVQKYGLTRTYLSKFSDTNRRITSRNSGLMSIN